MDAEELDLEHQGRVGGNGAREAAWAVGQIRRDGELALAADLHAGDALIPALDHAPGAELELERLAAILAGIELLAVGQPARVVDLDRLTRLRLGARARGKLLDLEFAGHAADL